MQMEIFFLMESADDAEQRLDQPGQPMFLASDDLDIQTNFLVGLRYSVCIPPDAEVLEATITFTADSADDDDEPTDIKFAGERTGASLPYSNADNLVDRQLTDAAVLWEDVQPWFGSVPTVDTSPDLTSIVEEIRGFPDWPADGCGYLSFIISAQGQRDAATWDIEPDLAPWLKIVWQP